MDIIFATGNADKVKEFRRILGGAKIGGEDVYVYSMKDKDIHLDIVEDGQTFLENAMIKAHAVAEVAPGAIVLADDSGLCVDYLNGEPGIYSARYMGDHTSYSIKNANIIERLNGVADEERGAQFVCAIAAVLPDGRELETVKKMEGRIGYEERGSNGFGFDPIFYTPPYNRSNSELNPDEKDAISHRGKALRHMKELLEQAFA